jgi:NTP pyrophosphatase (non-canonical NTP hydrolase)
MNSKSNNMQMAREFRNVFRVKNNTTRASRAVQQRLIVEEFKEFLDAENDLYLNSPKWRAECLKELADLVYVCYQYAANMEWDLDEALDRVHTSNLSKLDEEGNPIYREDGKVLKGPNYKPPNLIDLV